MNSFNRRFARAYLHSLETSFSVGNEWEDIRARKGIHQGLLVGITGKPCWGLNQGDGSRDGEEEDGYKRTLRIWNEELCLKH